LQDVWVFAGFKETNIMRSILYGALLGFSIAAGAQSVQPLAVGTYTTAAEHGPRSSGADLIIKDITRDGRITGTVHEHRGGPMCGVRLPANGLLLKDGQIRVEVNDGAPEGCERTYLLERAPDGSLKGEAIHGGKRWPVHFAKR
jgi:hypothetical protein